LLAGGWFSTTRFFASAAATVLLSPAVLCRCLLAALCLGFLDYSGLLLSLSLSLGARFLTRPFAAAATSPPTVVGMASTGGRRCTAPSVAAGGAFFLLADPVAIVAASII